MPPEALEGLAIPLPQFRQPLPPEDSLPEDASMTDPPESPGRPATTDDADDRPAPPPPSPAPPAADRTATSTPGDPKAAADVLAGLLVIATGLIGAWLLRTGRTLRQPTTGQVRDIAQPLGRILARRLPAGVITGDLADVTAAAAATHAYVIADQGPLVARTQTVVYSPED